MSDALLAVVLLALALFVGIGGIYIPRWLRERQPGASTTKNS